MDYQFSPNSISFTYPDNSIEEATRLIDTNTLIPDLRTDTDPLFHFGIQSGGNLINTNNDMVYDPEGHGTQASVVIAPVRGMFRS
jgi:hypothetical protein